MKNMNLVTLYIIILRFFGGSREVFCELVRIFYVRTSFRECTVSGNEVIEVTLPSKILFFFYKINFHDKWYSHLKTPKKKNTTLFMTFSFFIALRTSCRIVLCMSNKRVSFRSIFRYAEKIWIVSTPKEGDKIYCRRCNWYLLWHRLIRIAAPLL